MAEKRPFLWKRFVVHGVRRDDSMVEMLAAQDLGCEHCVIIVERAESPEITSLEPVRSAMNKNTIRIRLMKTNDFAAVVKIDGRVLKAPRPEYYKLKFEELVQSADRLPTSLVAEEEDGTVVGFVMGELFIGEYGISQEATLDTIGVDPDYQRKGIGEQLIKEFMDHLKALGVRKVSTLVDSNDSKLMHFFRTNQFGPSKTINLERSLRC